jgi:hypothetical protein
MKVPFTAVLFLSFILACTASLYVGLLTEWRVSTGALTTIVIAGTLVFGFVGNELRLLAAVWSERIEWHSQDSWRGYRVYRNRYGSILSRKVQSYDLFELYLSWLPKPIAASSFEEAASRAEPLIRARFPKCTPEKLEWKVVREGDYFESHACKYGEIVRHSYKEPLELSISVPPALTRYGISTGKRSPITMTLPSVSTAVRIGTPLIRRELFRRHVRMRVRESAAFCVLIAAGIIPLCCSSAM